MNKAFTTPVAMLSNKGSGGEVVFTVIGLILLLAIANRRDPTVRKEPFLRTV